MPTVAELSAAFDALQGQVNTQAEALTKLGESFDSLTKAFDELNAKMAAAASAGESFSRKPGTARAS